MEALGAISAVLQVAQFGFQVSTSLYHIADAIKSANKETHFIAKDISLFCTVLRGLGHALQDGQKSGLYRQSAFDTSLKIVEECRTVFRDIEDVLKKVTKSESPLDCKFSLPRGEKLLWQFRKSKVEFLRGVLASLKSTIQVELAVLSYASKVTSPEATDTVDVEGLLALKDLVIDNGKAVDHLRDLHDIDDNTFEDRAGAMALNGVSSLELAMRPKPRLAIGPPADGPDTRPRSEISDDANHGNAISRASRVADDQHCDVQLDQVERYELALRKLAVAHWEQDRMLNLRINPLERSPLSSARRIDTLKAQLSGDMYKFGMTAEQITAAMAVLDADSIDRRTTISYPCEGLDDLIRKHPSLMGLLQDASTTNSPTLRRCLPSIFDDILWNVSQEIIMAAVRNERRHHPPSADIILEGIPGVVDNRDGKSSEITADSAPNVDMGVNRYPIIDAVESVSTHAQPDSPKVQDSPHGSDVGSEPYVGSETARYPSLEDVQRITMLAEQETLSMSAQSYLVPKADFFGSRTDRFVSELDQASPVVIQPTMERSFDAKAIGASLDQFVHPDIDHHDDYDSAIVHNDDPEAKFHVPDSGRVSERHPDTVSHNGPYTTVPKQGESQLPSVDESDALRESEHRNSEVVDWLSASQESKVLLDETKHPKRRRYDAIRDTYDEGLDEASAKRVRLVEEDDELTEYAHDEIQRVALTEHALTEHEGRSSTSADSLLSQARGAEQSSSSRAAMERFMDSAKKLENASRAATNGSIEDDFDFAAYQQRQMEGVQSRSELFQRSRSDGNMSIVKFLLSGWTIVDDPVLIRELALLQNGGNQSSTSQLKLLA